MTAKTWQGLLSVPACWLQARIASGLLITCWDPVESCDEAILCDHCVQLQGVGLNDLCLRKGNIGTTEKSYPQSEAGTWAYPLKALAAQPLVKQPLKALGQGTDGVAMKGARGVMKKFGFLQCPSLLAVSYPPRMSL
jgi:hypothetical protein